MIKSPFQKVYPEKGYMTLDGGLNTRFEPNMILDNESPDCLNVIYDSGKVQTRPGSKTIGSGVGSHVCDGLYTRHDSNGHETMVAWFGGSAYYLSNTTLTTIPSAQSVFTVGKQVASCEYENYIFFGNGTEIPMKYNGADFTRHGIYAPLSGITAATAGTGTALTGQYQYAYTNVNSMLVESDLSPLTTTITVSSKNIALAGISTSPASWGVASRNIYRTKTSGAVFYRCATIANNTATTYEDATPDSLLALEAPDDQSVPPKYSNCVVHQSRVFVIDPATNLIQYSEIGNPYVFKALSFYIGDRTADIPKTLTVYNNGIVVGCQNNAIFLIYMPSADDTTWQPIRIPINYGSDSPNGCFIYNNKLMIPVTESTVFLGFMALSGNNVDPAATILDRTAIGGDLKSNIIESEMRLISDAYRYLINAIVFKNRAYISVPSGYGQSYNNRIWYFDFSQENLAKKQQFAFAPWEGIYASFFTVYDGKLYCGDSRATGKLYELLTDNRNDDGGPIDSYLWTKELFGQLDTEEWMKDWRWLNMFYENTGLGEVKIYVKIDSQDDENGTFISTLLPNYASSYFDSAVLDTSRFDVGNKTRDQKISIGTLRGKSIQFKFTNDNTANTCMSILGMKTKYNLRGLR